MTQNKVRPQTPPRRRDAALTVALINLGCPKNLVDAERLLGTFARLGWTISEAPEHARLVLVNTCGFIDEAKQESIDTLFEAAALKETAGVQAVVGIGCLIERFRDALTDQMPEIDAWAGLAHPEALEALCRQLLQTGRAAHAPLPGRDARQPETGRLRLTPRFYAYVRIAEGCDNRCTYCVIPRIRGPYRSKPAEAVLEEVRELAADGAREINVIAQDTTRYGQDLPGDTRLAPLLRQIADVPGVYWVRLLYTHPAHLSDDVIDLLAAHPRLCPYIDLPIQHIADDVLRRMGRRVTRADVERLLARLRRTVPDIAIRTSLIVGFPGETEAQFEELVSFVRETRFDRLGVFAYSQEEGTAAYDYPGQVADKEKRRRLHVVMKLQQQIALELNRAQIGRQVEVLVETATADGLWEGRTARDAPEIDGRIHGHGACLSPGQICTVRVSDTRGHYDLEGVPTA